MPLALNGSTSPCDAGLCHHRIPTVCRVHWPGKRIAVEIADQDCPIIAPSLFFLPQFIGESQQFEGLVRLIPVSTIDGVDDCQEEFSLIQLQTTHRNPASTVPFAQVEIRGAAEELKPAWLDAVWGVEVARNMLAEGSEGLRIPNGVLNEDDGVWRFRHSECADLLPQVCATDIPEDNVSHRLARN